MQDKSQQADTRAIVALLIDAFYVDAFYKVCKASNAPENESGVSDGR